MFKLRQTAGFTLIELLVVIAIIGILSAVLYGNFQEARVDARNKAVQSEMKELQLALELYKAQNDQYPAVFDVSAPNCATAVSGTLESHSNSCGSNDIIVGLVPEFIPDLLNPQMAANDNCDLVYKTDDSRTWYKLVAEDCHEGTAIAVDDELARCPNISSCTGASNCSGSAFDNSYAVYSAGAECE